MNELNVIRQKIDELAEENQRLDFVRDYDRIMSNAEKIERLVTELESKKALRVIK